MADLDSKLSALGASLRESVRQPDVGEVIDRSHRRTTRRNLQVVVIAIVAVIAVAIPLMRTQTNGPAVPLPPPGPAQRSSTLAMDFYDADHGFALWVACPSGESCTRRLSSTQDGKVWKTITVPRSAPGDFAHVQALGPKSALIQLTSASTTRFFTGDAGQSWHEVSRLPQGGKVDQIPDRAVMEIKCAGVPASGIDCVHDPVVVVLPDSGRVATLATQPPFQATHSQPIPDRSGAWWISGIDVATGNTMVAKTTDRGRSWQVSPLPWVVLSDGVRISVYGNTQTRYMIVAAQQQLSGLLRSTDDGRTWQPVAGERPPGVTGAAEIRADGTLVLRSSKGSYLSRDGGHSFEGPSELTWLPPLETRAGVLTAQPDESTGAFRYRLSDGDRLIGGEIPRP